VATWAILLAAVGLLAGLAPSGPAAPTPVSSSADKALRLVARARQSFESVHDYSCTLVKREFVNGQLLPENVMAMKVRNQPFSVHFRWLKPKALEGQEACYVTGKNNGLMRVKPPGLLGAMGFINIDIRDPRVRQQSRHTITEAGIGNLIERFAERLESERHSSRTRVRLAEFEFNGRKCIRVETSHPHSKPGEFYAYRYLVYFDKEIHLPIRSEAYDWPKEGGQPDGELLECFSFTELKLNPGLPEETFNH
jgi:hypothetical protein